ncbi:Ig-like domain-containing protein [Fructobacillus sp. M1-13]|uniref:SDR-like Ig domain-containing protein n=1 Tax=Fructobacillus papyriferae TaxID=2713171 RepID=A0ABS5QNY1_9LACO|nr:Ig-like domain-containing protein [Fructobacillus papyriferae]MBS9334848.1 hypothetical protein [Fructobacillus papyriferae]MCD2158838.1 Ig-like domain-containing protein [Fructobacillus papyriferae]
MQKKRLCWPVVVLMVIMMVTGFSKAQADSAANPYITKVSLTDLDHPDSQSYGPYDNMKIHWDFLVAKGTALRAGEQMTVTVPKVFSLQGSPSFDITDSEGQVIAHCKTADNHQDLTVTWTDTATTIASQKDLVGYLEVTSRWQVKIIDQNQRIRLIGT